jgi:ribosomal protein S5
MRIFFCVNLNLSCRSLVVIGNGHGTGGFGHGKGNSPEASVYSAFR